MASDHAPDGVSASAEERGLPRNLDAEQAVLAACLLDGGSEVMVKCVEKRLLQKHFYGRENKVIYQAMLDLHEKGSPTDEVVVLDALQSRKLSSLMGWEKHPSGDQNCLEFINGYAVIAEIVDRIETTAHADYWIDIVLEKAYLRDVIRTCNRVVGEAHETPGSVDEFLEAVEQSVFRISQERIRESAESVSESVQKAVDAIQLLMQGKSTEGISTGFSDLDKMTFGFRPGEMIVLAARPSMGKTSLAMNIAEAAALAPVQDGKAQQHVLVFSLEMTSEQLAMRMLCSRARVNLKRLRDGFPDKGAGNRLGEASRELKAAPMFIDEASYVTILEMRAKARRVAGRLNSPIREEHEQEKNLGLIIIDYLQLINGTDSRVPREQQIAEISRGVKAMAKELNVPVLVLSQLNRESEKEKRLPRLSDLRESGSIEQDADVVLLLASAKDDEDKAHIPQANPHRILIVAKNRNGPVGNVDLTFIPDYTRFENYAPVEE